MRVLRTISRLAPGAFLLACAAEPPMVSFDDATAGSGVDFDHVKGSAGDYFLIETMAAGGAFADFDSDGHLDIYLVNGFDLAGIPSRLTNVEKRVGNTWWTRGAMEARGTAPADPDSYAVKLSPASGTEAAANVMYRNSRDGTFTDATAAAGAADRGYGFGCAVADYDNDGDQDLYVTNYGANVFYRNAGDGSFADATAEAEVEAPQWSTSAAFFDYDNDGSLDLYIAGFLDFTPMTNRVCGGVVRTDPEGLMAISDYTRSYCAPKDSYGGVPDVLYRNETDGSFADVSVRAGIANPEGKGLGVVAWDYDRDGDQDLFVANDGMANYLYRNEGDGTFADVALQAGMAFNGEGRAEACMGVDLGDYDNDGDFDLFTTNFSHETNTLYASGGERFRDMTAASGLAQPSWRVLGFGTGFFDYDNDGDLDLYVANGHILERIPLFQPGVEFAQPDQLFANRGGSFADVSDSSGTWFAAREVGRGAAFGDYDNDGDLDLLVTNCGGPAKLLRNRGGNRRNWSMIRTVGSRGNRDGIGAEVRLVSGGLSQIRVVQGGSSYLSAGDRRLHFGLGSKTRIDTVEVRWPGGGLERFHDLPVNQLLTLKQDRGTLE